MNSLKSSRTAHFDVAAVKASRFESLMPPTIRTVRTTTKRAAGIHSRPLQGGEDWTYVRKVLFSPSPIGATTRGKSCPESS